MDKLIYSMCNESIKQLNTLQKKSPKKAIKQIIKKSLGKNIMPDDPIFWPAGMLLLGLSEAITSDIKNESVLSSNSLEILTFIEKYTTTWLNKYAADSIKNVDDTLAGFAFIQLYEITSLDIYKTAADRIYHFITTAKTDSAGSIIYHPEKSNSYIFADGTGMSALFLAKYGSVFHITSAMEKAKTQIINYINYGFDSNSNLPYHGYEYNSQEKMGLVAWGRAIGWLMMGYSEILSADPYSLENTLKEQFISLSHRVIAYQRNDGSFSWLTNAIEAHADTSATSMIAYSLKLCLAADKTKSFLTVEDKNAFETSIEAAKTYLSGQIKDGVVLNSLGECIDFSMHPQKYGTYPWGQGAALAFLSSIM